PAPTARTGGPTSPPTSRLQSVCTRRRSRSDGEDDEVLTGHVDSDIVDRHGPDEAVCSTVMCVPVDAPPRPVHADRPREPTRAEERPDALGLAHDRVDDRRIVEK